MRITLLARARFCAALSSLVLLSSLAQAQYSGNVQGFVLDPSGAAVAGASVTLHNIDTGVENVGKTSDSGNYRFSSLPPGNYRFQPSPVASNGRKWRSF
jgi:protocatechuate 3,4-dioxygenase beta subunit